MAHEQDSEEYLRKKNFFRSLLTIYGRKPVLEALSHNQVKPFRLHLADSNKPAEIIQQITQLAEQKNAEIVYHSRQELARISKNTKQDQGVCVDLICPGFKDAQQFLLEKQNQPFELLALDGITNPQNLGMIIRSATAGFIDGILLPEKGTAQIDPLVIKASAGTVFKANIIRCKSLPETLADFKDHGGKVYSLAANGKPLTADIDQNNQRIFVLGNETDGVSSTVAQLTDHTIAIPMNNGVESLNVAVTASLLCYRKLFIN